MHPLRADSARIALRYRVAVMVDTATDVPRDTATDAPRRY